MSCWEQESKLCLIHTQMIGVIPSSHRTHTASSGWACDGYKTDPCETHCHIKNSLEKLKGAVGDCLQKGCGLNLFICINIFCGRRRTKKCLSNQNARSERFDWLSYLPVNMYLHTSAHPVHADRYVISAFTYAMQTSCVISQLRSVPEVISNELHLLRYIYLSKFFGWLILLEYI